MRMFSGLTVAVLLMVGCESDPTYKAPLPEADVPLTLDGPRPDDADAEKEFTATATGLKYKILRKGSDNRPKATDEVIAHYRGWLDDGTEFDSSYKRGAPTPFPLNGVIKGWTEGLQLIGEGGKIELEIPPDLGYGSQDKGNIPPGSTLHFIVELERVK